MSPDRLNQGLSTSEPGTVNRYRQLTVSADTSSYDLLPLLGVPRSGRRQVLWLATRIGRLAHSCGTAPDS